MNGQERIVVSPDTLAGKPVAKHTDCDTIPALKALPFYLLHNKEYVARFEREIVVLQRLQHQNIVRVFESGYDEALQLSYFVMEYVEGKSLKQLAKTKKPLWQSKAISQPPPRQDFSLFTVEGKLKRERFDADAFRTLVATTAESHCVGDTRIAAFHLFISLTRGPFVRELYQYLSGRTGKDLDAQLKVVRALVRQTYRRPIVEERLIVRELRPTDLEQETITLLNAAALLARQGIITENHLLSALLGDVPVGLRSVLPESGITLANLQRYTKEKGQ